MKLILSEKQLLKLTEDLKEKWKEVDGKLERSYTFPSYEDTIEFVNKVADIAKEQDHHPEMVVGYDKVKLIMFDHEKGGISDRCHKFTKAVDDLDKGEIDERSRSFAFTRKKRLFPKSAIMANPNRFKYRDRVLKDINNPD